METADSVASPATPAPARDVLSQTALNCYFQSLRSIADCIAEVCPTLGMPYRLRLMRELRRLGFRTRVDTLEASCTGLSADLQEFSSRWRLQQSEGDRAASDLLAELSASIKQEVDQSAEASRVLLDAAEQLSLSAEVDSPEDLRRFVGQQAAGLEAMGRRLETSARTWPKRMGDFVTEVEGWMLAGNAITAIDPLTGLYTRREIESRIRGRRGFRSPHTFLRFDFETQSPSGGPVSAAARELLLGRLGEILTEQVRPRDFVSRWTDTSFVVVMEAPLAIAVSRGPDIARWMSDSYALREGDTDEQVDVRVTVAIVDPLPEESPEMLLERIHSLSSGTDVPKEIAVRAG